MMERRANIVTGGSRSLDLGSQNIVDRSNGDGNISGTSENIAFAPYNHLFHGPSVEERRQDKAIGVRRRRRKMASTSRRRNR